MMVTVQNPPPAAVNHHFWGPFMKEFPVFTIMQFRNRVAHHPTKRVVLNAKHNAKNNKNKSAAGRELKRTVLAAAAAAQGGTAAPVPAAVDLRVPMIVCTRFMLSFSRLI